MHFPVTVRYLGPMLVLLFPGEEKGIIKIFGGVKGYLIVRFKPVLSPDVIDKT
jgi:hypothetical protein